MLKRALGVPARNVVAILVSLIFGFPPSIRGQQVTTLKNEQLSVTVRPQDGSYEIRTQGIQRPILTARVGAEINRHWIRSSDYPNHQATKSAFRDALGRGQQVKVTFSGLRNQPELVYVLRLYETHPYGHIEVRVVNISLKKVTVQAIRSVEATGEPRLDLGGHEEADRVLSDSFGEAHPTLRIYDLGQAPKGLHRGVGSQLIYNRESKQSLFMGALGSQRFLTILRLQAEKEASGKPRVVSFTVDSTGTTEIQKDYALKNSPAEDQVELSLPLAAGERLSSEPVMFAAGKDYHAQLDEYGKAIRVLHHPRDAQTGPMGWWSWTAYYYGLSEGTAITNAQWLAKHLKALGYDYFHIDEGYQYADGEYTIPNASMYPHGMVCLAHEVSRLGLKLGVWVAPFRVSCRSRVYEHHKEWLVHNARGYPIQIGFVEPGKDPVYILDTTHPGAQNYLLETFRTMVREWGVRYFKLDFMADTAIEGQRYRPNTTALEAQRIGLQVIRKAVGENVLLDKDSSPMLNPVGLVDEGRISQDTGHAFWASKDAASGIAARYYMNHNFYISDPDAFTVSPQLIPDQTWHQSRIPLTLDEAQVSIALAAMAGGMYEIGDDLPTLGANPDRLALVENHELLQMVKLGQAAIPLDLMTYPPEDEQPSVFILREDKRQSILAVFNWTEQPRSHTFSLADLKLSSEGSYDAYDVFDNDKPVDFEGNVLRLDNQPRHSVRLIKIINMSIPAAAPTILAQVPARGETGRPLRFSATSRAGSVPAVAYHWDFGDGTSADGPVATHAYTRAADYTVLLKANGIDGVPFQNSFHLEVRGIIKTQFNPLNYRRYMGPDSHMEGQE